MENVTSTVTTPQNIGDVEELVRRLYQTSNPELISQINAELQKVQLSNEGWQVADALLGSQDSHVQFFGALTFTVKLNTEGPSLDPAAAQSVLSRLIFWLVQLSHDENTLAGRKLCSSLAIYFLRSPVPWLNPVKQLALSFIKGRQASDDEVKTVTEPVREIWRQLDWLQFKRLLWFCSTLADEVGRVDAGSVSNSRAHDLMETFVPDVSALMDYALQADTDTMKEKIRSDALECFQAWVNYAQPIWPRKPENLVYLQNLVEPLVHCLSDQELQGTAIDVLRDILESYTSFFQPAQMKLLAQVISTHIGPPLKMALQENDPDGVPYGQLIIAYGDANIQHMVENTDEGFGAFTILDLLLDMLKAPGHPGDDDELSTLSIEFWNTFTEYVTDASFSYTSDTASQPDWVDRAKQVLSQVIHLLWRKMTVPPTEIAGKWNDMENEGFKEFRLDSTDLMLSTFVFLGNPMLEQIVAILLNAIQSREWRGVEAAIFSLNTLADNVMEDQPFEDALQNVFNSSLFRDVADFAQNIPLQTRRTAIDMLGAYGQYIERHAEFLPDTVRFLFASLETALSNTAAKSIASLCSTCRSSLTTELPGFLQQYQRFLQGPTSDAYTKEKVIGAIASIIQALRPDSAKIPPLSALLEIIETDINTAKQLATSGDMEAAEVLGVDALHCLASIGKGLQVPEDVPIDLYDDDGERQQASGFWQMGEGQAIQQRITGTFSILSMLTHVGEAVDAACQVLRSGFAETEPGPFVLPPSVTVSFIQQCSVGTPQLETVLSTASTLIAQHSRYGSPQIDNEIQAITEKVVHFITELSTPANDPGVASGCIEVLYRMSPRYLHLLLNRSTSLGSQLPAILAFVSKAIDGVDYFPKRSGQEFWARFLKTLKSNLSSDAQAYFQQVVEAYGPELCQVLMCQIGGQGQRSELDLLCEPLRAVIQSQPAAKTWLEIALVSEVFPSVSEAVGVNEKRRFLQQLIGVRADIRKMRDVVREFYAACRGTVVTYGGTIS